MNILVDDKVHPLTRLLLKSLEMTVKTCQQVGIDAFSKKLHSQRSDAVVARLTAARAQGFDVYVTSNPVEHRRTQEAATKGRCPICVEYLPKHESIVETFRSAERLAARLEGLRQEIDRSSQALGTPPEWMSVNKRQQSTEQALDQTIKPSIHMRR